MTFHTGLCSLLLLLTFGLAPATGNACSAPKDHSWVSFNEELERSSHVFIVRVESQALEENEGVSSFSRSTIAKVRVVDVLVGNRSTLETISYYSAWCGGHRLDVGGYYVVVLPKDKQELSLGFESENVVGLGDEYTEPAGDNGVSTMLMYLRNFAKGHPLPAAFNVKPYVDLARMPSQAPSFDGGRR